MRSRLIRIAAAIALASTVALSLAACDPGAPNTPPPPVAYTSVNGNAVVRTCVPMTITDIAITDYDKLAAGEILWEARGTAQEKAGTEFVLGATLPGLHVVTDRAKVTPNEFVEINMDLLDSTGKSHYIFTDLTEGDLRSGVWVDGSDIDTRAPCTPGTCPDNSGTCTGRWHGVAAAQLATPTIFPSPVSNSAVGPGKNTKLEPISFTLKSGLVYAELCAPLPVGTQTFSPPDAGFGDNNGPADVETSTTRKEPAGTEWLLGAALPGGRIISGGGQQFTFSKGSYEEKLEPTFGGAQVDGKFQSQALAEGVWLDSAGDPEASACSAYDAANKG